VRARARERERDRESARERERERERIQVKIPNVTAVVHGTRRRGRESVALGNASKRVPSR